MRFFYLVLFLVSLLMGSGMDVYNGQTALLEFDEQKGVQYEDVLFDKKRYKIFKNPIDDKKYYALLPISYYE